MSLSERGLVLFEGHWRCAVGHQRTVNGNRPSGPCATVRLKIWEVKKVQGFQVFFSLLCRCNAIQSVKGFQGQSPVYPTQNEVWVSVRGIGALWAHSAPVMLRSITGPLVHHQPDWAPVGPLIYRQPDCAPNIDPMSNSKIF